VKNETTNEIERSIAMTCTNATRFADRLAVIHVRFAGQSFDVPLANLNVGPASADASVKQALAGHLDIAPSRLDDHVVDRHANGNLTLRPEAVFG
jgi:hypothetical protein